MVFSSPIFLFAFLPLFLAIYYLTPFRGKSWVILGASYLFYAWWRIDFVLLFFAVTLWNYWNGLLIARAEGAAAKRWLVAGVLVNLGVLGYFKYANFGIENLNALLVALGGAPLQLAHIILPIGISFYIFHCISYLVDLHRKDAEPIGRFVDFAAFIALFPQLICGPILRYKDLAPQFRARTHSVELFAQGAVRFMIGFVKKVLIADSIAPLVDMCFGAAEPGMLDAWIGGLAFCLQLYFDFSGYSSMAVGIGLMMGFRLTENFNMPFLSQSYSEFWRRWHMSLMTWLRDYVYIPLGGSSGGLASTNRNIFITIMASALWHGANWTFVMLGLFMAGVMMLERIAGASGKPVPGLRGALKVVGYMLITIPVFIMFRAESVTQGLVVWSGMAGLHGWQGDAVHLFYPALSLLLVAVGLLVVYAVEPLYVGRPLLEARRPAQAVADRVLLIVVLPLFLLAVSRLLAQHYTPFLYFAF
ncbi:MAG: rane bound O-acyl transferase, family protein [Moraxellaceae bacterium]|jgi:alginate O-acetyltransferase complex protein AlgI|nr:rane bound O-acyl transferase, family protein [Moraxellaceae bacterium]